MATKTIPKFIVTLIPASGGEWEIKWEGKEVYRSKGGSLQYLHIDDYEGLAPHWYAGDSRHGNRVRDNGERPGIDGVPIGCGGFARAVKSAGGLLLVQPWTTDDLK